MEVDTFVFPRLGNWAFKIGAYVDAMPPHAVFVTPEPDFATHNSAAFAEPAVPQLHDACYLDCDADALAESRMDVGS